MPAIEGTAGVGVGEKELMAGMAHLLVGGLGAQPCVGDDGHVAPLGGVAVPFAELQGEGAPLAAHLPHAVDGLEQIDGIHAAKLAT